MKKFVPFLFLCFVAFNSCVKDVEDTEFKKEVTIVLMGEEYDPEEDTPFRDGMEDWMNSGDPLSSLEWYIGPGIAPQTPMFNSDNTINSSAYNCHYYAFGVSSSGNNPNWPYWSNTPNWSGNGYSPLGSSDANQVGDRVIYFKAGTNGIEATHSGIVTGVSNGNVTEVTSKWGEAGVYQHAPGDVPPIYSNVAPTFEYNGQTYESRVYFRQ